METCPQQTWTAVQDGTRGLAVISTGLLESCVRDQPDRPLALTLFRATRRTIFSDGEPGGQLQGELTFNYWIVPLAGPADRGQLLDYGTLLGAGLRVTQLSAYDAAVCPQSVTLPPSASLLQVNGRVAVTSVREVEGGIEVRLFNPGLEQISATIDFGGRPVAVPRPRTAQRVNLESRPLGKPAAVSGQAYSLEVRPMEIVTLRFQS